MPTIRQIAKAAQVSPMTVSYVLNNRPGQVSDETRARVLRVVREMGYRPRATAPFPVRHSSDKDRAAAAGNSAASANAAAAAPHVLTLGVATASEFPLVGGTGYFPSILSGLMAAANRRGQNLTLFATSLFRADPIQSVRTYCDGRCDGLFLIAPGPANTLASTLRERGVAHVLIGDRGDEPSACVDLDNRVEAKRITTWLIEQQGHRRIGFVGFPGRYVRSAQERFEGFAAAMQEHGLPIDPAHVVREAWKNPAIYDSILQIARITRAARPTALVCWNDDVASRTLMVLRDAGVHVPQEISIVGFDDDAPAALSNPPLTTLRQPYAAMAEAAVDLLDELIAAPPSERETRHVLFPGELIQRASVAPPPPER